MNASYLRAPNEKRVWGIVVVDGVMAKPLVSDGLWARIEPLLPRVERRYRYPGRKRVPDRQALAGILFVLKTGIPWEDLPQEMGCG